MIETTDIYDAAKRAGAKPLIYLLLGTNYGRRCYGKETPNVSHLASDVFQWEARALAFGDIRQSVSSDSDSIIESLYSEEMGSCSVTLDNADGELSRIIGSEVLLAKSFEIVQGFDTPDFAETDFLSLFFGKVTSYQIDKTTIQVNATQSSIPVIPADPSVDTSNIYTLSNPGTPYTAASETIPYTFMETIFYSTQTWVYVSEIHVDTTGEAPKLFKIENDGDTRLEIGVTGLGYVYVKFTEDLGASPVVYTTLTSSVVLGIDEDYTLTVKWDADAGTLTIQDGKGQSDVLDLSTGVVITYERDIGSSGSSDGEFQNPNNVCIDASGNIYVTDAALHRVQKFDNDGTFLFKFGSSGTGDGQFDTPYDVAVDNFGNIYVVDIALDRVQKFDSDGNFVLKWGSTGTGDGEFKFPAGITVNSVGTVLVTDRDNSRVQQFSSSGTFYSEFGSVGSGNGQFAVPKGIVTDGLNNIYVVDASNSRIQKFTDAGAYISQFGSSGTGDGEFDTPNGIDLDASGNIYVADDGNDRVQVFSSTFTYLREQSGNSVGVAVDIDLNLFVVDSPNDTVVKWTQTDSIPVIDFSDTGTYDDLIIGEDFAGDTTTCKFNDTFFLSNDTGTGDFQDSISGLDISVVDGTWVEVYDIDEYLILVEEIFQIDALTEVVLPDTTPYTDAGPNQQNVTLPLIYGDTSENSDVGVSICPLINETAHVYCVSGWPILSLSNGNVVNVYVDGVLTPTGWTFDESNDYQSQGDIAILTFTTDPGGDVTVSCKGKSTAGVLLTNPIDIIEDFVEYSSGLVGGGEWQLDESSFARARNDAVNAGYVAAGVMQANNTLGFWLKSILKPFLGSFRFSPDGLLQVSLQPTENVSNIFETLNEYDAITVKGKQSLDNICGRILVNYAVSFATIDRRFKNNGESSYFRTSDASQDALNPQTWELDFDWCRRTSNIETVQQILLGLYADPEYIVDYLGQDFKFVPVEVLDQVSATLSFILDSTGAPVENVPYSLRQKIVNLDTFTTTLSMQSINFVDISPVLYHQLQFGGVDVQFGGINVTFGGY